MEGFELTSLPQWLDSGVITSIAQIQVEVHDLSFDLRLEYMTGFFLAIQAMKQVHGFNVIHYQPNMRIERQRTHHQYYFSHFDIVLYRT